MSLALFVGLSLLVGCEKKTEPAAEKKVASKEKAEPKEGGGKHDTWWCDEHGVKEADCSMCSAKAAKAFQDKGDWCKDHNRAKSQCFICDPKLQEKFAAEYVAKYGKQPPEPEGQKPDAK
ncbi:hypothetical protein PX52LOC_07462 [Limnoglobus roseus]|uniref:RND transporter n=2 Tax=Limnoglobus roseus TaxID=2598579 RepID=A0A5C1ALS5_9BACT|nr:hypothetical protein PX52LOC_07462 [Limnoglobus roseus]